MNDQALLTDVRVTSAIDEIKELVRAHYSSARFEVSSGPDPGDIYLIVTVDTDDPDDVMAVYIDRLVELQVESRLPLYVMSLQAIPTGGAKAPSQATNQTNMA